MLNKPKEMKSKRSKRKKAIKTWWGKRAEDEWNYIYIYTEKTDIKYILIVYIYQ